MITFAHINHHHIMHVVCICRCLLPYVQYVYNLFSSHLVEISIDTTRLAERLKFEIKVCWHMHLVIFHYITKVLMTVCMEKCLLYILLLLLPDPPRT